MVSTHKIKLSALHKTQDSTRLSALGSGSDPYLGLTSLGSWSLWGGGWLSYSRFISLELISSLVVCWILTDPCHLVCKTLILSQLGTEPVMTVWAVWAWEKRSLVHLFVLFMAWRPAPMSLSPATSVSGSAHSPVWAGPADGGKMESCCLWNDLFLLTFCHLLPLLERPQFLLQWLMKGCDRFRTL